MATFLARFSRAAAPIQPASETAQEPAGDDARGLQARLAEALRDAQPKADIYLLNLYQRYRETRQELHRVYAGRADSETEAKRIMGRRDDLLRQIAKMPATTLRGFGAKMDVLRNCECAALEKACPQNADEMLLQSIAADSYKIFGSGDALLAEED